jgi:hypothetical protein
VVGLAVGKGIAGSSKVIKRLAKCDKLRVAPSSKYHLPHNQQVRAFQSGTQQPAQSHVTVARPSPHTTYSQQSNQSTGNVRRFDFAGQRTIVEICLKSLGSTILPQIQFLVAIFSLFYNMDAKCLI